MRIDRRAIMAMKLTAPAGARARGPADRDLGGRQARHLATLGLDPALST